MEICQIFCPNIKSFILKLILISQKKEPERYFVLALIVTDFTDNPVAVSYKQAFLHQKILHYLPIHAIMR